MNDKYFVRRIGRGEAWHVCSPSGHPIYDDSRDGDDKPLVFRDLDTATECAERLNKEEQ